jgi:hypothetical protein
VVAGDTPVLVHNCGETPLYRVPPRANAADEFENGLNPSNFPRNEELDGAAHFGNQPRVSDFAETHADTHGPGYCVNVPTCWLRDNNIEIWEGMDDQLEYVIPSELFDEFNQFPRTPWSPGGR